MPSSPKVVTADQAQPVAAPIGGADLSVPSGAEGLLMAILATGGLLPEGLAMVTRTYGRTEASRLLVNHLHSQSLVDVALGLMMVGSDDPLLAQVSLAGWLRALHRHVPGDLVLPCPWVLALPANLHVVGQLVLQNAGLTDLPEGLTVDRALRMSGSNLRTLPHGLKVGGQLFMTACPAWDGRWPADLVVGGQVVTDRYPMGCPLWIHRGEHPNGERD
jgi:hypothetical protein